MAAETTNIEMVKSSNEPPCKYVQATTVRQRVISGPFKYILMEKSFWSLDGDVAWQEQQQ